MWKLFPESWLRTAGFFGPGQAADAALLEKRWRAWLSTALARPDAAEESGPGYWTRLLCEVEGSDLLGLDSRIRAAARAQVTPQTVDDRTGFGTEDDGDMDACVFVACCHPNGYIRERGLIAFRERGGGVLALAAGLICSTDWVSAVRMAAISLAENLILRLPAADIVRYLDLAVSLQGRLRVCEDLWRKSITPRMLEAESREALWAAARDPHNSRSLRQTAFMFLLRGQASPRLEILQHAVVDSDPVISRWAFEWSASFLQSGERSLLVETALQRAHASVRQKALRERLASSPADARDVLHAALLDSSRGVRALAAFELGQRYGESPLPVWRAAVDSSSRQQAQAASLALLDAGEREEVERLAGGSATKNAAVRATLLRALERVDSSQLRQCLERSILDESNAVRRLASRIYRRSATPLEPSLLEEALAKASPVQVPSVMTFTDALGRWDALELLLRHAAADDPVRAAAAVHGVLSWSGNSGKALPPTDTPAQAARLHALFVLARARHGDPRWKLLELVLRSQA